jgi:hypothetical protein
MIATAIQQNEISQRVRGAKKPNFLKGFDEADRGKDLREGQTQESSATSNVRLNRDAHKNKARMSQS